LLWHQEGKPWAESKQQSKECLPNPASTIRGRHIAESQEKNQGHKANTLTSNRDKKPTHGSTQLGVGLTMKRTRLQYDP
jgi:hypothetical protein